MRWAVVLALLWAVQASAIEGRFPRSGPSGPPADVVEDPWIRCSDLPDPAFSVTSLTQATSQNDLHADIMAACGSGCIVEIGPGTYTDNIVFGDTAIKATSVTPTGEVLIRAADPSNPPVIRAELGVKASVIYAKNVTARIRLEDLILDGRRSEQTVASIDSADICTDTTPDDGVCDGSPVAQTSTSLQGFDTRNTGSGVTSSCLLRVQVRETVGTGIQLTDAYVSTVEDSTVTGAGCTTTLCPLLDIPADATTNAILKTAQGVQLSGGSDSSVIESTASGVTKIGIECFAGARRCHVHDNTISSPGIAGIILNESDGTVKGNTISDVGLWFSPNLTTDNVGIGIQTTNSNTYASSTFSVAIEGNTIDNVFSSGIQAGLAGTSYNDMRIDVTRNVVRGACNGTTRGDSAGIELGDSTYDIAQITASYNSNTDDLCIDGMRVRNVRTHRNSFNGTSSGLEVDDVDEFHGRNIDVTGNIDIDADTNGYIRGCEVSGMVIGSDGVQRTSCGEIPGEVISNEWDTMVWDVDEWG